MIQRCRIEVDFFTFSKMNQARISHLVSKLKYKPQDKPRKLRNIDGPAGRIRKIQKTLTALLKYERIELNYRRADEVRGYAERLISEAIRHGPTHQETMNIADYWIEEKQFVHKLFKVLVPRFQEFDTTYTKLHRIPKEYPGGQYERAVLELRGNPYPSIDQSNPHEPMLLHNILLDEARREYRLSKYQEFAESLTAKSNTSEPQQSEETKAKD
ncbi:39S ribosomal protein L17, mitochondrial [Venturia canescens]|uniref:39S ribosomal protein L17, mitochondrial n=1 Tax=Venturia canescens TaxID=32260 RepID=UPI001C9CEA9F|nr:39S ribosomal protein L17, mitochondrial [Venturia canescens]